MGAHTVSRLKLRVRTGPKDATSASLKAQTFTQRALERIGDILEQRHPHRIVLLRRVPLRVSVRADRLISEETVDRVARKFANRIERELHSGTRPDRDWATYDSQSAWLADALAAEAERQHDKPWHLALLGSPARLIRQLCTSEAGHSPLRTLHILHSTNRLQHALHALNRAELACLAEAIGVGEPHCSNSPAASSAGNSSDLATTGRPLADWGAFSKAEIIQRIRERVTAAASPYPAEYTKGREPSAYAGRSSNVYWSRDRSAERPDSRPEAFRETLEPAVPRPERELRSADDLAEPGPMPGTSQQGAPAVGMYSTELGGLFYLLSVALELELGETLWKACLPEPQVILQATNALIADRWPDDPAPRVMGTLSGPVRPVKASPEQVREVVPALFRAFVDACPRRGLGSVPDLDLRLVRAHGESILCATVVGSPCVLYAAPAGSTDLCRIAIERLLGPCAESKVTLYAPPELVEIDRTARLRLRGRGPTDPGLFLPPAADAASSILLGVAIGVLCQVFAVRVKQPSLANLRQLTDRHFARRATIEIDEETIRIRMSGDAIDLAVRRAGLDRDPGWVPWLNRTVRILFREGLELL